MIARHITTHEETGMRLLAICRDIHRTPVHSALDELALELAARARGVVYAQQRCGDGAAVSKAYPCDGRVIVDTVYFSDMSELRQLYMRGPLGDGLFFADAPRIDRPSAVPAPELDRLTATAAYDEFVSAVSALFPDEDVLAGAMCALRTGQFPLALIGDMPAGEFSRRLHMALELMLRALPADAAAELSYLTLCGDDAPCDGVNGCLADDDVSLCRAYISLPDGVSDLEVEADAGDYARAEALLCGTLSDVMEARGMRGEPARDRVRQSAPAPDARPAKSAREKVAARAASDALPELDRAHKMLSASLRYANSPEFRRFSADFLKLRGSMDAQAYFQYALTYSDYLHRMGHSMHEVYDTELASLFCQPPEGLQAGQIARTLTRYPGALNGAMRHIERMGAMSTFVGAALPRITPGEKADDYAVKLLSARATLASCLPEDRLPLLSAELARAADAGLSSSATRVTAESLCAVRDAIAMLMEREPTLNEGMFDRTVGDMIDRIEFARLDEYDETTYAALSFAYSYVRQWNGQVTDRQRAVCLWGRLMGGFSGWNGCVMDGMLELLRPMSPAGRADFLGFVRRYFAAMCDGGLDRTQMSESVVMITVLSALRIDAQGGWRIDELSDVLDRLAAAGEGLEHEFWQQVDTRVDLLPIDMLDAAHGVSASRADIAMGAARRYAPAALDAEEPLPEAETAHEAEPPAPDAPGPRRVPETAESGPAPYYGEQARIRRTERRSAAGRERRAATAPDRRGSDSRRTRSRSYDYGESGGDGGYRRAGYSAADMYRREYVYGSKKRVSGDTIMLIALLMLLGGALAFCIVNFLL